MAQGNGGSCSAPRLSAAQAQLSSALHESKAAASTQHSRGRAQPAHTHTRTTGPHPHPRKQNAGGRASVRTRSRVSPSTQTHVLQICPGDGDPPSHSLSPLPPGLPINSPPPRTRDTARPRRASIRHSPGPCCRRRLLQLLAARRTGSSSQHPRSQPAACAWTPDRSSRRRLPGRPMGRAPCCDRTKGLKKGPWTPEEDKLLVDYIQTNGHGSWRLLPKLAGRNHPSLLASISSSRFPPTRRRLVSSAAASLPASTIRIRL